MQTKQQERDCLRRSLLQKNIQDDDPPAHKSTGSLPKCWADEKVNSLYVIIYQNKMKRKRGKIDFPVRKTFGIALNSG